MIICFYIFSRSMLYPFFLWSIAKAKVHFKSLILSFSAKTMMIYMLVIRSIMLNETRKNKFELTLIECSLKLFDMFLQNLQKPNYSSYCILFFFSCTAFPRLISSVQSHLVLIYIAWQFVQQMPIRYFFHISEYGEFVL